MTAHGGHWQTPFYHGNHACSFSFCGKADTYVSLSYCFKSLVLIYLKKGLQRCLFFPGFATLGGISILKQRFQAKKRENVHGPQSTVHSKNAEIRSTVDSPQ
jgi:hypothetical protein